MARRCDFLESFPGFNYNSGIGETTENNSVMLGSTVLEAMMHEVMQMCEKSDYQNFRKENQQVIL